MLSLGMGVGWGAGICSSHFREFRSSLVQQFTLFQEFHKIQDFQVPRSLLRDWLRIGHRVVRKIVLYVVYFAYTLLSLLLSLVVLVFPLLSY